MKTGIVLLLSVIIFGFFTGCDDSTTNPEEENTVTYTKLVEGYTQATKVEVYVEEAPYSGYNHIYIALSDSASKKAVTEAQVTLKPIMDMGMMVHSAPLENPSTQQAQNGYFAGAVIFIMSGMWQLEVSFVRGDNQAAGSVNFEFEVAPASLVKNVTGSDSVKYFITLMKKNKWQVGMNDIEFCLNKKETMMNFPPVTDMTMVMDPWMDMGGGSGHGSPNNENPAHQGSGHYKGKVNFTMSGDWDINLDIKKGIDTVASTTFSVTVE